MLGGGSDPPQRIHHMLGGGVPTPPAPSPHARGGVPTPPETRGRDPDSWSLPSHEREIFGCCSHVHVHAHAHVSGREKINAFNLRARQAAAEEARHASRGGAGRGSTSVRGASTQLWLNGTVGLAASPIAIESRVRGWTVFDLHIFLHPSRARFLLGMSPFRIRYRVLTLKVWAFFVFRHGEHNDAKELAP